MYSTDIAIQWVLLRAEANPKCVVGVILPTHPQIDHVMAEMMEHSVTENAQCVWTTETIQLENGSQIRFYAAPDTVLYEDEAFDFAWGGAQSLWAVQKDYAMKCLTRAVRDTPYADKYLEQALLLTV